MRTGTWQVAQLASATAAYPQPAERCLAQELQQLHRRFMREASAAHLLRNTAAAYDQVLARLVEGRGAGAAPAPDPASLRNGMP